MSQVVRYKTIRKETFEQLATELEHQYNDHYYYLVGDWKVVKGKYEAIVGRSFQRDDESNESILGSNL